MSEIQSKKTYTTDVHVCKKTVHQPKAGDTCLVGMSGGVDSSLTALLLKERGCTVIGVTMSVWRDDLPLPPSKTGVRTSCYGPDEHIDIDQCKVFCREHGFEYHVIDCSHEYKENVFNYFKQTYRDGKTPNPCIKCNPYVKFGALLSNAEKMGISFDYFCTGHYASLIRPTKSLAEIYGDTFSEDSQAVQYPVMIDAAFDKTKDQCYFLYRIPSSVLERVRFPLASMTKKEVIEQAKAHNLIAADRSESQDFIPSEYLDIIFADMSLSPGDIVDMSGKKIGEHRGIQYYTVGQRKGLGVAMNHPVYVHSIDAKKNQVVLGENDDLLRKSLLIEDCVWAGNYIPKTAFMAFVKIRFATKPVLAVISPCESYFKIDFKEPVRAVAPGQSAVIYIDGIIFGGGIIV